MYKRFLVESAFAMIELQIKRKEKNTKQDDQGQRNNKNKLLETSSKRTFKTASDITTNCIWESKAALRESIDFYRCSHVGEH